jgi:hypothetical protein
MIFLLNLEIAYCMPPLGLNLFISAFRFERRVSSLYRVVLPFVGVLAVGLVLVSYVPWLSDVGVARDVTAARAKAEREGAPPRDAWMMECVQQDPASPQPCSAADRATFPGGTAQPHSGGSAPGAEDNPDVLPDAGCNPDFEDCSEGGQR